MINWILNALTVLEALIDTSLIDDLEKLERRKRFVEEGIEDKYKDRWQYKQWMKIYDNRIKQLKATK